MTYTQSQNRATQKWNRENYDEIKVRVPKGKREEYKALAEQQGKSLNSLIVSLLDAELKK